MGGGGLRAGRSPYHLIGPISRLAVSYWLHTFLLKTGSRRKASHMKDDNTVTYLLLKSPEEIFKIYIFDYLTLNSNQIKVKSLFQRFGLVM